MPISDLVLFPWYNKSKFSCYSLGLTVGTDKNVKQDKGIVGNHSQSGTKAKVELAKAWNKCVKRRTLWRSIVIVPDTPMDIKQNISNAINVILLLEKRNPSGRMK